MRWHLARPLQDRWFAALIALLGLVAGALLWLLTVLVSRAGLAGNGWSLSGNGVLVIPFGVGPPIVVAGWSAIILRLRSHPRWLQLGLASGLIGLGLMVASFMSLIVFGPAHRDAGAAASLLWGFLLYGWLLAGAVGAAMIPAPDPPRHGPPVWSVAAILLLPLTLIAGCEAGTGLLAI